MKSPFVRFAATLGLVAAPALVMAQQTKATAVEVTPYAGYFSFGNLLDGPLGTSLRTAAAPVYGAQLGVSLVPGVSLIGNVGYSRSNLEVGIPILGGVSLTNSSVWVYDAGVQLGGHSASRQISPFLQVGAGAMRYDIGGSMLSTHATSFAANAGVGADIRLSPSMGLRLMAKDYVGKFDFKEAAFVDYSGKTTHNVALSAGVRIGF